MDLATLRRLWLPFEDFSKNHNLILISRPTLLSDLDMAINRDIKSRVTYSVVAKRLGPKAMRDFLLRELDRVGLGHNAFTSAALDLVVRSAYGGLVTSRSGASSTRSAATPGRSTSTASIGC